MLNGFRRQTHTYGWTHNQTHYMSRWVNETCTDYTKWNGLLTCEWVYFSVGLWVNASHPLVKCKTAQLTVVSRWLRVYLSWDRSELSSRFMLCMLSLISSSSRCSFLRWALEREFSSSTSSNCLFSWRRRPIDLSSFTEIRKTLGLIEEFWLCYTNNNTLKML